MPATTPGSNNPFPSVLFVEGAAPATPASGKQRLFVDIADGLLKLKDDAGTVTAVGGGVSDHGALTGLADDDHTQYQLRSTLTTRGDLYYRGASAVGRLGIGTSGHVLTSDGTDAAWAAPTGGGGAGGPLAVIAYATGSDAVVGATTSSTTLVDVDATNAAITFTAPASGNVLVVLDGLQSGNANMFKWGIRESTTILAGANVTLGSASGQRCHAEFYITGVSAGSHTYKWAHAIASGVLGLYAGPNTGHGKIVMAVWACP